jgi:glutaconate CoA-transferase subunit B
MPRAGRTILWRTKHDPRVFVEKLDFVTATGNVDRVVTPVCVFRRVDGWLRVESVHHWVDAQSLQGLTGFPVEADASTPVTPPVSEKERQLIAEIDPSGVALSEF